MLRKLINVLGPGFVALAAVGLGLGMAASTTAGCEPTVALRTADTASEVAAGETPAVLVGDRIEVVDEETGTRLSYPRPEALGGVARHISAAPGQGTAYVADLVGPDVVVAIRSSGVTQIAALGEAAHPSWSSRGDLAWADLDFGRIRVRSREGSIRDISPPPGSTAVFSPIFVSASEIVAVVQEAQPGTSAEDATVDNLWRFDLVRGTWRKLTSFTADGSMWSAIRTPVVEPGGSVAFVLVHGDGQATEHPAFELWRLTGGSASRVRQLSGESFLAGASSEGMLWNSFDGTDWMLSIDRGQGVEPLGCGAVAVDPTAPDPDLAPENDGTGDGTTEPIDEPPVDARLAILVGDFVSKWQAMAVANDLGFTVIGHADAPAAVAPEAWAAVSRLSPEADPEAALAAFRADHPEFADRSWIVSLAETG
jgi:hypothetical protein